jgi:glycosyltransferase involved in cell wall biosynthesis
MNALHLCAGNLYGGVERIVAECAASSALAPGMLPAFAVCFDGRLAEQLDRSGVPCARLGDVRISRPRTLVRARRRLNALLAAERPDVVICHSAWIWGLAAPVVVRHGVRSAVWLHDAVSGRTWVERWAARSTPDVVICNSRFTARTAPLLFPSRQPVHLYAPVSAGAAAPDARQRVRAEIGADEDVCVILTAGRFEPWKGHGALIEALSGIAGPWQLWIAGAPQKPADHRVLETLQHQCRHSTAEGQVRFLGHRDDVRDLMAAADLLCQPNTGAEPFGLVFVEALYQRLPVVTSAMGGAVEILDESCGVLLPPGEATELRAALRALIADPPRRSRLGGNGPARARQLCDPARQLSALAAILEPKTVGACS